MDRRALNKSRMESEALRRAETSTFLADHEPPADYDTATKYTHCSYCLTLTTHRFAPKIQRPLSGRRQYSNVMNYSEANDQSAKIVVAKGSSKVSMHKRHIVTHIRLKQTFNRRIAWWWRNRLQRRKRFFL